MFYFVWKRSLAVARALGLAVGMACGAVGWHGPVLAAELGSVGKGTQVLDVCKIRLPGDALRMFWRGPDGAALAGLVQVDGWLRTRNERLVCGSNAGIYGKDLRPIGLYVEDRQVYRRLNLRKDGYGNFYLQPNGAFVLTDQSATIWDTDALATVWDQLAPGVRYATQSGPLLLQNRQINPLFTPGSDNRLVRNAVCTRSPQDVVLARSRYAINFYDFAAMLRDGLGCQDALYLDGSISELFPLEGGLGAPLGPMLGVVVPAK
jgi:uncharacterized protein YigE (DUF2233 family)